MISPVFCVFGCIFYLGVALDTEFGAHDRKIEPSEISAYNVIDTMTSYDVIIKSYFFKFLGRIQISFKVHLTDFLKTNLTKFAVI